MFTRGCLLASFINSHTLISALSQIRESSLAKAMNVSSRDLLPPDAIEDKVIVQYYKESPSWYYPESIKAYKIEHNSWMEEWQSQQANWGSTDAGFALNMMTTNQTDN